MCIRVFVFMFVGMHMYMYVCVWCVYMFVHVPKITNVYRQIAG